MFDIDKYLDEMEIKEMNIDKDVLTRTRRRCEDEQAAVRKERAAARKKFKKAMLIAVPAAAVLLIVLGALLFTHGNSNAVAYYTIDVNPSICVQVDADGNVTDVVSQNEDAQAIVDKLDIVGDSVTDAIKEIIAALREAGYFDAGESYVLIGCFAADGTLLDSTITDLQAQLEADFGDMIELLIVSGSLDDLQQANQLKVSAGLLKLSQLAGGNVTGDDKVEDVLYDIQCENQGNYCAPELRADVEEAINLSWDEMDFEAMGYAGKVKYFIAAGDTEEEAKSGDAPVIETFSFYTYGEQPLSCSVTLDPGQTKYFALYANYCGVVKRSNVVMATMPGELVTPSPSPTPTETPVPTPTETDEPDPTKTPTPAHTVSGYVSGGKVKLSWSKETADNFNGYKVVASKNNPHPKYNEDGYIKYITSRSTTSVSLYAGDTINNGDTPKLEAGEYYYFSVTYLQKDGTKIAGNAVRLKVPPKEEPDYPASTIDGVIHGNDIVLEWSEVPGENLQYYKVVASFVTNEPIYPRDGYIKYITCATETRFSFNTTYLKNELEKQEKAYNPGHDCWFSITVVYKDGTKVQGNAIKLFIPEEHNATEIRGSVNSTSYVQLEWDEISDPDFECYKVMYSFYDETPAYCSCCEGGTYCYDTIYSAGQTSCSLDASGLSEYNTNSRCWFSITVVYNDGVKRTGNTKMLAVHPYVTTINGVQTDNIVNLSWVGITGDAKFLDKWFIGYRVYYQIGDGSEHLLDVDGPEDHTKNTSISIDMSELTDSTSSVNFKFWIVTHYDGGVYKQSSKTSPFTYTPPEPSPSPSPTPTS